MLYKIAKRIFNRVVIVSFLVLVQIALLFLLLNYLNRLFIYTSIILSIISALVAVYILNTKGPLVFKMAWVVPILLFSMVGGIFYLILQAQTISRRYRRRLEAIKAESSIYLAQDDTILHTLADMDEQGAPLARYMGDWCGYPAAQKTKTEYFPLGEDQWRAMLRELKTAKRYIFLEYFILREGVMWDSILEILRAKAAAGVEVRILYDGMGSISTIPDNYHRKLEEMGIRCRVFSPFVPFLSAYQNNRDHRKICVIDGRVAFTGGNNIGDEYINIERRFGHWRDSGVMMTGDAAYHFAVLFLRMWRMVDPAPVNYAAYRPTEAERQLFIDDGVLIPYGDCPTDDEPVSANVYLDMIAGARRELYITTPYLILDDSMISALALSAKRGVDVRILIPAIPDKWYTYDVATSYFEELIENGIRIYKYKPGFIHSKSLVCDGQRGVIGTINLDYRSLYLHYECGVWMSGSSAVAALRADILDVLDRYGHEVTLEDCRQISLFRRILSAILRLFAPLM